MKRRAISVTCCTLIAVLVAGAVALSTMAVLGGRPSALVRMSRDAPVATLALERDSKFILVPPDDHYDGEYFYAIAIDPFAVGNAHKLIDLAAYRYGHAGFGLLAWLVSGGHASAVPTVMVILNLIGMGAAAFSVAMLATRFGRSVWWGLVIAINPGLILAVISDTAEPVGLALALAGVLAWLSNRRTYAVGLLTFAALCKEYFVLVPVGLILWQLAQSRRQRQPVLGSVLLLAIPINVFAVWLSYVKIRFHASPFQVGGGQLAMPFTGWISALHNSISSSIQQFDKMQVGMASLCLLVILGATMFIGLARAVRWRSPFSMMFAAFVPLTFSLNAVVLTYPKDLLRYAAVPIVLLPFVFFESRVEGHAPPGTVMGDPGEDTLIGLPSHLGTQRLGSVSSGLTRGFATSRSETES